MIWKMLNGLDFGQYSDSPELLSLCGISYTRLIKKDHIGSVLGTGVCSSSSLFFLFFLFTKDDLWNGIKMDELMDR